MATLDQYVVANQDKQCVHLGDELSVPGGERAEIEYPESEGKPIEETEFHVRAILHLYSALRQFFLQRGNIYVAADMFLYYEKGNPLASKTPDVWRSMNMWQSRLTAQNGYSVKSEEAIALATQEAHRTEQEAQRAEQEHQPRRAINCPIAGNGD